MTEIQKMLKLHRAWLRPDAEEFARGVHEDLRRQLAEDSLTGFDFASDLLGMLATHHGIRGLVAVDDGVEAGWTDLANAMLYRYWALRLLARSFSKKYFLRGVQYVPNLTNHIGNAGCLLAGFIATERNDLAAAVADILLGMVTVDGAVDAACLRRRRFEPFMLWLYSQYSGDADFADFGARDPGVYQRLIDGWGNADELAPALAEACAYHLSNNDDTGGARDPEFKNAPFDLLPLEIRAIATVRRKQGLQTPAIDHPLLSAPIAAVENLQLAGDEVVAAVERAYRRYFED